MVQPGYVYVVLLTIIVNIPFGYLRGNKKRFSFLWFLYIHLPVPLVIYFRNLFEIDLTWSFAPAYFGAYLFGQWIGQKIFFLRKRKIAGKEISKHSFRSLSELLSQTDEKSERKD